MREQPYHWHAGCKKCRHLIYAAANNQAEVAAPPTRSVHALCPYCSHAAEYAPTELVLHSGYGTIYFPPDRNLTDTTLLVAGFLAAIKLARVPEDDLGSNHPKVISALSTSTQLAELIVRRLAQKIS